MNAIDLLSLYRKMPKKTSESLPFEGLDEGLPLGALVEVSGAPGSGKTQIVLRFLAQNPGLRVAWVEENFSVYPCAFPQNQVALDRVLFVDSPPGQALWSTHQLIRGGIFQVVVLAGCQRELQGVYDEKLLRRLQLAAEKGGVTVILLSESPAKRGTWPISVQLQISRRWVPRLSGRPLGAGFLENQVESEVLLDILKYKGQKSWQMSVP
ncbi:hypothetical protein WDW37_06070 [Bdellovibrionota bacterium FG-1]